jgi:hypothetical protein
MSFMPAVTAVAPVAGSVLFPSSKSPFAQSVVIQAILISSASELFFTQVELSLDEKASWRTFATPPRFSRQGFERRLFKKSGKFRPGQSGLK